MVIETRALVFNQDELMQSAHAYCLRSGAEMPEGEMSAIDVGEEATGEIKLTFSGPDAGTTEAMTISYAQMAAALLLKCREIGIPIPRHARKRLEPAGENMVLRIRVAEDAGPAKEAAPERPALPAA